MRWHPSRAALARQRSAPHGADQERSPKEDQNEEGGSTKASAKTLSGGSPRQQSPSDADASGLVEIRDRDTATERPLIDCRAIGRTHGRDVLATVGQRRERGRCRAPPTFNPDERMDRRQPRRGTRPRKDRPTNALNKRAPVQTVLRSKASGDRFPVDTTTTVTLATAASRRSPIDGEGKSEEAMVRGDAHRLQERRVLRGV